MVDKGLMQRIIGALVLVALAVVFVPMLFNREDPADQVELEAPAMPATPEAPEVAVQPVEVPEPVPEPSEEYEIIEEQDVAEVQVPASPIREVPALAAPAAPATPTPPPAAPAAPEPTAPAAPAPKAAPAPAAEPRLDANNLPVSWSVQLASLSSRENAEKLQQKLRSQGYNAYIRTIDGMNRVFVGPLLERNEANRLRDQLQRQQKLDGFVVRFRPEGA